MLIIKSVDGSVLAELTLVLSHFFLILMRKIVG